MDVDISDILASVTRQAPVNDAVYGSGVQQEDLQALTRTWISERVAPELLSYPAELLDRVMGRIRTQVCTSSPQVSLSNGEHWRLTLGHLGQEDWSNRGSNRAYGGWRIIRPGGHPD